MVSTRTDEQIKEAVRQAYGGIARRHAEESAQGSEAETRPEPCCGPSESTHEPKTQSSCCGPSPAVNEACGAARFYSGEELSALPDSVTDVSLGCGNPLAIAGLQPGEVVLDLGSGGGIDCFLAAKQVGPEGRVIGLDMTTDMIKLARRNAKKVGATNVDFRYGEMEDIPVSDESVDVIISNCVINLSPDKDAVFREAYRVLRPGGRISVSDMVVDGQLPQPIRDSLEAWAGCIAGALDEADYLDKIRAAGFHEVEVLSRDYAELDDGTDWEAVQVLLAGPDGEVVQGEEARALLSSAGLAPRDLARTVASIKVQARKPESGGG
jgi:arsenite methyltransferase